jgi:hypothetical protein
MKAVVLLVLAVAFCGAAFAADPRLMPVRILTDKQWKAEKNGIFLSWSLFIRNLSYLDFVAFLCFHAVQW